MLVNIGHEVLMAFCMYEIVDNQLHFHIQCSLGNLSLGAFSELVHSISSSPLRVPFDRRAY